ncbi:MAG: hypothetical protein AAGF97_13065 [Planctomycetota bacterium]
MIQTPIRSWQIRPWALAAAVLLSANSSVSAAETLSDFVKDAKWDDLIGTWVDAETQGATLTTTYAWRLKDRVIEITTTDGNKESIAWMGVNGKTGDVFHMGVDGDGASSLGKWIDDDGDAVLELIFTSGDGQEGGFKFRNHFKDSDTMTVTLELPDPVVINMVRKSK